MTSQTETQLVERARELNEYIANGRIVDAMHEFYSDDCVLQENTEPPTQGKQANIEREKAWLATVKEWKSFNVVAIAASGNVTMTEATFDYVTQDGQDVHVEQVARAIWSDGRIVNERFYHN